jgi:hypothetical protein
MAENTNKMRLVNEKANLHKNTVLKNIKQVTMLETRIQHILSITIRELKRNNDKDNAEKFRSASSQLALLINELEDIYNVE